MSTKPVSDRVAKRRLLELAALLDTPFVAKHFNFSHWGASNLENESETGDPLKNAEACGTTACALGWAPSLPFAKKLGIELYATSIDGGFRRNGRRITPDRVAKLLFGLNRRQAECIFYPGMSPFWPYLDGSATPSAVARNIRKFVRVRFG